MPEIKMIANGFALQFVLGEDYESSIMEFDSHMHYLHFSGEMAHFAASAHEAPIILDEKSGPQPYIDEESDANRAAMLAEARLHNEAKIQEQLDNVYRYGLPYVIENRDTQYMIFNQDVKHAEYQRERDSNLIKASAQCAILEIVHQGKIYKFIDPLCGSR